MTPVAHRNLHVPLSPELHLRLHVHAKRLGRPATEIAREAIDRWLVEAERTARHEAISAYAAECAGTASDLDTELEAASVEHLLDEERRVPGARRK